MGPVLETTRHDYTALIAHLLPNAAPVREEAAFGFARPIARPDEARFRFVEWFLVPRDGYAAGSGVYLELSDETRAGVIKRAHDLEASLVEFHSHPFPGGACFSGFDLEGLAEFVPHVRWRLRGRPYFAFVVAPTGYDALAWSTTGVRAETLGGMAVGRRIIKPSGRSLEMWRVEYGDEAIRAEH